MSPVVTVEPRRRKFHKAITLSMPAPRPHTQGMTNQYSTSSAPTLRLLCSISGTMSILASIIKLIRPESVAGNISGPLQNVLAINTTNCVVLTNTLIKLKV